MSTTGVRSLDQSIQTAKDWLGDLQRELSIDDQQRSLAVFRAVVHALRDRLTVEQATDLAAQLPMVLQGVYYHEYNPAGKPLKIRNQEDFLSLVQSRLGAPDIDAKTACTAVFAMLQRRIAAGEITDLRSDLPEHINQLWP